MPNIDMDIAGYFLEAGNKRYPIEAGHIRTTHENQNVSWDWEIALELKLSDAIPAKKRLALLYPDDASVFVHVEVIKRRKEGNLSVLTLVPWMNED
jgi:hypothetical protein